MKRLEVSGAVRPIYLSVGVKRLIRRMYNSTCSVTEGTEKQNFLG